MSPPRHQKPQHLNSMSAIHRHLRDTRVVLGRGEGLRTSGHVASRLISSLLLSSNLTPPISSFSLSSELISIHPDAPLFRGELMAC